MKTSPRPNLIAARNAYSLIELLVYISVLAIVMGFGYAALYQCMDNSAALRGNSHDIVRALQAGERWRTDVRNATRGATMHDDDGPPIFVLRGATNVVAYRFDQNAVARRIDQGAWQLVLTNVQSCSFNAETRPSVSGWRWELELQPRQKSIRRIPPLFTFLAVPTTPSSSQ